MFACPNMHVLLIKCVLLFAKKFVSNCHNRDARKLSTKQNTQILTHNYIPLSESTVHLKCVEYERPITVRPRPSPDKYGNHGWNAGRIYVIYECAGIDHRCVI